MEDPMTPFARIMSVAAALFLLAQLSLAQTVAVSPSSKTVNLPNQFTFDVVVNSVTNCRAASIAISFNHDILTFNSAAKGSFMPDAFAPGAGVSVGSQYDIVTFDQSVLGATTYSGSGTLVTYTFTAKAVGTTAITIETADLRSPPNNPISVSTADGSITVDPPLPITLVSFQVSVTSGNYPMLSWKTISEIDNYGFMIQRKSDGEDFADLPQSFVAGHGTTTLEHEYTYIDSTAGPGVWSYRLKQMDNSGEVHYSDVVQLSVVTSVGGEAMPTVYALEQNYPNPFNPTTTISYQLPAASHVTLVVFDVLGRQVATLVNGVREAGHYKESFDAAKLGSGVYFYQLRAGDQTFLKKMLVVK
jgi:hypothetical protein